MVETNTDHRINIAICTVLCFLILDSTFIYFPSIVSGEQMNQTYTNLASGIKIQYPSNWQQEQPDNPSSIIRFRSPTNGFLSIAVHSDVPSKIKVTEETAAGIDLLNNIFERFNLTDITSTTLAGNPAQRIEYTAIQDQIDLKFIQIVTIKDGKEYIITFGTPKGQFPNDMPAVQKMINSFQIINTNPTKTTSSTALNNNADNNHAPVALGQTVRTNNNKEPVTIILKATDQDQNTNLKAIIVSPPHHGRLSGVDQATGKVTYTPNNNYFGDDSFTYKVNDGKADSNIATVKIAVQQSSHL
jgi:hypothetical protein